MKTLLVTLVGFAFASAALADIHDPPSNDYGPTRKLGRGISNMLYGWSEIPVTIAKVNKDEGNAAAASYGVVRGVGRAGARFTAGLLEVILWPVPAYRQSYYPLLPRDTHWIHAGYSEFPPELGYESKYPYVRDY
jgi:putative exosortase-associated protein (TIGR04073 family)